jgi:hypothetical protein
MATPLPPQTPKLPSRRVSVILATAMLAVGIALGALIGPGPATSLASSSRAAAIGRVLALLALGSGTSSGGDLLLSSGAAHPPASTTQPTPPTISEATPGSSEASGGAGSASSSTPHSSTSSPVVSPTSSTKPAASGEEESEKTPKTKPLPPIADVWLIELPYGASLENALKQSTAAPYLDGQLKGAGTALSGYSSLAASQLAGAATLLSGQVGANVTTIAPPPCGTSAVAGATSGTPSSSAVGATSGTTPSSATGAPASGTSQPSAGTPCPAGEPAGVQSADAFLREVVPKIEASSAYKEHGLIVITFGTAGQQGDAPSPTEGTGTEVTYPAGSLTSTLTAAGSPAGALLLSPFLRHPGRQSASAFNPLAPHESLEALLRAKAPS